ncbi:MAG: NADH-quinone oxidoreductase subunit A [Planctomycetota bacterium]
MRHSLTGCDGAPIVFWLYPQHSHVLTSSTPLALGPVAENAPADYLPVLLLLAIAVLLGGVQIVASTLLGRSGRSTPAKESAYECGIEPTGAAHTRFSVKFYLVAVLFILFDVEVVFLYPWSILLGGGEAGADFAGRRQLMGFLFLEMLVFLGILILGWYWVVRKGALDWEES